MKLRLRVIPDRMDLPFMRWRKAGFAASAALMVLSVVLFLAVDLNYGIDFRGGILMEVGTPEPAELATMRGRLEGLGLGEIALQEFGAEDDVLIRIERQEGAEAEQLKAVEAVKASLEGLYGAGLDYRRTEFVGPKVGSELIWAGVKAVVFALLAMLVYIWFRFEWQFSIGAVAALVHDVVLTIGMFALLGLEFNLATVAAILLIVGYSMNDTVVVYDRVRENLRKYKKTPLVELLSRSINDTLSRTLMTSITTLLALGALWTLGGPVIRDFCFAMIWGVVVGTYSSIFVAAPLLISLRLDLVRRREEGAAADAAAEGGGG
jgi:preprotein translocase SecF subunit